MVSELTDALLHAFHELRRQASRMMRLTCATIVAILVSAPSLVPAQVPSYAQRPDAAEGSQDPAARVASQTRPGASTAVTAKAPFEPLSAAAQAQLQQTLQAWEQQSQATKTLECKFQRWHYDNFAAPAGFHATRADGVIKYAAPDKGLFRVDQLAFYAGADKGEPQYKEQPGQFGEHWVCNGTQLIEFDRSKSECRIQDLPPEMQGKNIISSPLPFVFNLNAAQIQQRYWVRQVAVPDPGIIAIEAWPKRQEDRAQYKAVLVVLEAETFLPKALIMYAPNFDAKTAPKKDHYEFLDVKRNAIGAGFQKFLGNFIPEKPPANWKILRDKFNPAAEPESQQAAAATVTPVR